MRKLIIKLTMVFMVQVAMALFFYRSRALLHASWTTSDLVVFGLPLAVGFAGSILIMFFDIAQTSSFKRLPVVLGLSALGAVASSFVGLVIAFNLYGT